MTTTSEKFPGVRWVAAGRDFISVDAEKCNGCGDCVKVCLAECFAVEKGTARVKGLDECMECASCWYICDREAIRFSWPKGGAGFRTRFG
jgi:NAD-dependent dihydropyrimidine dehydrogenase PreA subunit